jgi:excisionase family DNA binding protein
MLGPSRVKRPNERLEPLLVRPAEAALLLGISRSKLYELLAAGEIPAIKIGRSVRIPVIALEAWISHHITPRES